MLKLFKTRRANAQFVTHLKNKTHGFLPPPFKKNKSKLFCNNKNKSNSPEPAKNVSKCIKSFIQAPTQFVFFFVKASSR